MVKKLLITSLLSAAGLWAQGLSLTIGPPIASPGLVKKGFLMFAVRINGCADLSKAQITTVGEGIVGGQRKSVQVPPAKDPQAPGVYAIGRQWSAEGKWIVAVSTTCGNETAGAIVPVTEAGFVRERTQMVSHAPTQAEIDTALKAQ